MTVGDRTFDNRVATNMYLNGSYIGNRLVGQYRGKTWSGTNAIIPTKTRLGPKRYYTTLDPRTGKVSTRWFRMRPLKRASRLAPQPYTMSSIIEDNGIMGATFQQLPSSPVYPYVNANGRLWFSTQRPAISPPVLDANDQLKLVNKLKESIRGSDFNLAVFLGESHQTLQMIGDTALALAKSYRAARKGDFLGAARELAARSSPSVRKKLLQPRTIREGTTSSLANNWLELQYGWLPLLGDMRAGAMALSHALHAPFVKRYSAQISKRVASKDAFAYVKSKADPVQAKETHASSRRRIVAYISEPESLPVLSGLLDPELVAWELTPFSFVIDWFLPVGDYLEARAFASRLHGTFVTSTLTKSMVHGLVGGDLGGFNFIKITGGDFQWQETTMSRTISVSLDVPMPIVKSMDQALSWKHCTNALALLNGVLKGALRPS